MKGTKEQGGGSGATGSQAASSPAAALLTAFAQVEEPDRYRLLAEVLAELAEQARAGVGVQAAGSAAEIEVISKKLQSLSEERATLLDRLATAKADLDHGAAKLEAEQTRGHELQLVMDEQRDRLEAARKKVEEIEAQLDARNAELHKCQMENESLLLQVQRAEGQIQDHSKVDRLEESQRGLATENETLRSQLEQLRVDKDAEIARLNEELATAHGGASKEAEITFAPLWERLASADPPLVEGHVQPNAQAAARLVDSYIELVRFVDDFDQLIRPFLTKYTRDHPPVKVPWDVYARRGGARQTVQQIITPVGGKPAGILRVKLRGLYKWIEAAMIGCDVAIESIESELQSFAMHDEPYGAGSDPNRKIKEFLRESGPGLFLQSIRKVRGEKIETVFGRGS